MNFLDPSSSKIKRVIDSVPLEEQPPKKQGKFTQGSSPTSIQSKLLAFCNYIDQVANSEAVIKNDQIGPKLESLKTRISTIVEENCDVQELQKIFEIGKRQLAKRLKPLTFNELKSLSDIKCPFRFLDIYETHLYQKIKDAKTLAEPEKNKQFSEISKELTNEQLYNKAINTAKKITDQEVRNQTFYEICRRMSKCAQYEDALIAYQNISSDYAGKMVIAQKFSKKLGRDCSEEMDDCSFENLDFACGILDRNLRNLVFKDIFDFVYSEEEEEEGQDFSSDNIFYSLANCLKKPQGNLFLPQPSSDSEAEVDFKRTEMAKKIVNLIEDPKDKAAAIIEILSNQMTIENPKFSAQISQEMEQLIEGTSDETLKINLQSKLLSYFHRLKMREETIRIATKYKQDVFVFEMLRVMKNDEAFLTDLSKDPFYENKVGYLRYLVAFELSRYQEAFELVGQIEDRKLKDQAYSHFGYIEIKKPYRGEDEAQALEKIINEAYKLISDPQLKEKAKEMFFLVNQKFLGN